MAVRFKKNSAGFEEVLRQRVNPLVDQHTEAIRSRAGAGYYGGTRQGRSRYRGIVYARSWRARRDNAKNNTLVKALG